jgi:uncharacterized protein YkwD
MLRFVLLLLLSFQLVLLSNPVYSSSVPETISALELSVHDQVNQYRGSLGLASLELNEDISKEARIHSQQMAQGNVPFSHDGFDQRIEAISSTLSYSSAAENVAYNQGYDDPVTVAVEGWINSPGHQKNMAGNFNLSGVGVAQNSTGEYYFTQIFILKPD